MKSNSITIVGAKENNLKNISLTIPKNKLVVFTGLSGSGKSTLAFDVLYQEGQRRYIESLSSYARQFLGSFEKPKVERIDGLQPAISIDQKTKSTNPRSTVGTVTEIYDYLRLIYGKIAIPYDNKTNKPYLKYSVTACVEDIFLNFKTQKITILIPIVLSDKLNYKELFKKYSNLGIDNCLVNNKLVSFNTIINESNTKGDFFLILDRVTVCEDERSRIFEDIEKSYKVSNGFAGVLVNEKTKLYNEEFCFDNKQLFFQEPSMFSFNTPLGACPVCNGIGTNSAININLVLNYDKPLLEGGFIPYKNIEDFTIIGQEIMQVAKQFHIDLSKKCGKLSDDDLKTILFGSKKIVNFNITSGSGRVTKISKPFEGLITRLERRYHETQSNWIKDWLAKYMTTSTCPSCGGRRLNNTALSFRIGGLNISEVCDLSVSEALNFFTRLTLSPNNKIIAENAINEIISRLQFLKDVGLDYLTLSRSSMTLSGGESQRIRLATQIGSNLSGVLYVLDEPSIGLHQKDNDRLISSLKGIRDLNNSVVVVEHDEETIRNADYIVDIGPLAGVNGGTVIYSGTLNDFKDCPNSLTSDYLFKRKSILLPQKRREINSVTKWIKLANVSLNNLKNISVKIPYGKMVVITGVSGSGKSSLINDFLLKNALTYGTKNTIYTDNGNIEFEERFEKIIEISQEPIGKTPRSNPATYTKVFDDIRQLFSQTIQAKAKGYSASRFSFNVKGGRCEECQGDGEKRISMHFLPDVYVKCEVCKGKKYNDETLGVLYKGKSIYDVLEMTIEAANEFFKSIPNIALKLQVLCDVGLGYLKLGQIAPTLSGGEAQRIKLASELNKKINPSSLYVLDEPTTGLHPHDTKKLITVLNRIVDQGATMIIIEHNLDVIKQADYIIDLGPDGGVRGGEIVAEGTPEEVAKNPNSYTGSYLQKVLHNE